MPILMMTILTGLLTFMYFHFMIFFITKVEIEEVICNFVCRWMSVLKCQCSCYLDFVWGEVSCLVYYCRVESTTGNIETWTRQRHQNSIGNRNGVFSNKGEIIPKTQWKQVVKHLKFCVLFLLKVWFSWRLSTLW